MVLVISAPLLLLIKTRFLTPEEFGYIAILSVIIGFLQKFEGKGFIKGVIQRDYVDKQEASTLFLFTVVTSALMAGALYISADVLANFFNSSVLGPFVQLMSLIVLINGVSMFFRAFFEKHFFFKEISIIEIASHIVLIVLMTLLFAFGFGISAFVYAQISSNVLIFLLYLGFNAANKSVAVSVYFSFQKLRHYMRFGLFTSGRDVLNFATKRGDEVIIGALLGTEILGIYYFGKNLLEQVRQVSNKAFAKVLFPLFSKLKYEPARTQNVYTTLTNYLSLIFFPVFIGIALTASSFVPVIFGEHWLSSVIVIQVFAVLFIVKILSETLPVNYLYSQNKPDKVFYIDLAAAVFYFTLLIAFSSLGIAAVITAYVLFNLIRTGLLTGSAMKLMEMPLVPYARSMKKASLFTAGMAGAVMLFQAVSADVAGELGTLIGSVAIGVIVYSLLLYFYDKNDVIRFYKLATSK
ncbi:polysaccharide biosynthesis protein [Salisediminibacterium halotolerans]|nr:polysaccharide biosynthesis protein [Salisediminibacterium halotolerans]